MTINDIQLPIEANELRRILLKNDVITANVFGSYARNEATQDSDLDLLVKLKDSSSLYKLIDIQSELEEITKCRVDVATKLHPRFEPYITPDLVVIL